MNDANADVYDDNNLVGEIYFSPETKTLTVVTPEADYTFKLVMTIFKRGGVK
ncbi:hypothetical protein KO465_04945 [Candidatus Micrarchaeota archaeon]|nr:hypothetical protein [Candidatus Micrarchaeota archaeon]